MRVLIFGDSITQGYWDTDGGWVDQVRKHYDTLQVSNLKEKDEPTVFNLGISADNSKNILERIESETTARTRHGNLPVIVIQIGTNDSSEDRLPEGKGAGLSIEKYGQNLRMIIDKIKPLSSKIVFVGLAACDEPRTTPVSWGEFYYTNKAIQSYETKIQVVAKQHGIAFIPIFEQFNEELKRGKNLLADGLHPNNEGHAFMTELILSKLDSLLAG